MGIETHIVLFHPTSRLSPEKGGWCRISSLCYKGGLCLLGWRGELASYLQSKIQSCHDFVCSTCTPNSIVKQVPWCLPFQGFERLDDILCVSPKKIHLGNKEKKERCFGENHHCICMLRSYETCRTEWEDVEDLSDLPSQIRLRYQCHSLVGTTLLLEPRVRTEWGFQVWEEELPGQVEAIGGDGSWEVVARVSHLC